MILPRCYDRSISYKPQWAHSTPAGYRDETFWVPFTFLNVPATGQLVRSLPWTLDDDVPYILRGIVFNDLAVLTNGGGLARIWDPQGNPLSKGLVLFLGFWSVAGLSGGSLGVRDAWFWPFEDEILCPPGGTLTFDFQLSTNAGIAAVSFTGAMGGVVFYAGVIGVGGNGGSVELIDPGAPNVPLSILITNNPLTVQVTLATDGGGVITSTWADIAALYNSQAVSGQGYAIATNDGTEVAAAAGPTAYDGGTASTPLNLSGMFYGVKRFKEC